MIGEALGARAAGLWELTGDSLVQVAFWSAHDLPSDVAEGFKQATERVPLSETNLGIVRAAIEGKPSTSLVANLSPEGGSGLWLRRFGAERSIAFPLKRGPRILGVAAVALPAGAALSPTVLSALEQLRVSFFDSEAGRDAPRREQ